MEKSIKQEILKMSNGEELLKRIRENEKNKVVIIEIMELLVKGVSVEEVFKQKDIHIDLIKKVKNRAIVTRNFLNIRGYSGSFHISEYLDVFGIKLVSLKQLRYVIFNNFMRNEIGKYANDENKIYYIELPREIKVKIKNYAANRGVTKGELLKNNSKYSLFYSRDDERRSGRSIAHILNREDIKKQTQIIQNKMDFEFDRQNGQIINLGSATTWFRYTSLKDLITKHITYINDVSFKERERAKEPAITMLEFINYGLIGYTATKGYQVVGDAIWSEEKIKRILGVVQSNEKGLELGSENGLVAKITDYQKFLAYFHADRHALREGISKEKLYAKFGLRMKEEEDIFASFVNNELSQYANDKNQIHYKDLSKKQQQKIRSAAGGYGVTWEELFSSKTKYTLITTFSEKHDKLRERNIDYILNREDIKNRIKNVQQRLDKVFKRKGDQIVDLDTYSLSKNKALYATIIIYVTYVNDASFYERKKTGEAPISVSEFINKGLKGYRSTRYYDNVGKPSASILKNIQEQEHDK